MIAKIRVGKWIFEDPQFIGFGSFEGGDGFLMVIDSGGKKYAISPETGRVFNVIERNTQLYVEIPYGKQTYRAPLRFKL